MSFIQIETTGAERALVALEEKRSRLVTQMRRIMMGIGERVRDKVAAAAPASSIGSDFVTRSVKWLTSITVDVRPSTAGKHGWKAVFFEYRQRNPTATVKWRTVNGVQIRRTRPFERRIRLHYRPFVQSTWSGMKEQVLNEVAYGIGKVIA